MIGGPLLGSPRVRENLALIADSLENMDYLAPGVSSKVPVPVLFTVLFAICYVFAQVLGFPGGSNGKESPYNAGDLGSIPGLGRSPGKGNGCPVQYSCLENSRDRGA